MGQATRAVWAKRVERWARSGLGAEAFAAREGVSPRTLSWWRWRLGKDRERSDAPRRKPAFVEVVPATAEAARVHEAAAPVELVLRDDLRVVVPVGFDPESLRALLGVLENR